MRYRAIEKRGSVERERHGSEAERQSKIEKERGLSKTQKERDRVRENRTG